MTATYADGIGTLACDECGATYTDGEPETPGSSVRMRAGRQGWTLYRPHDHRADDWCPDCSKGRNPDAVIGAGSPEVSALTHCPTCGAPEWNEDGRRVWNPLDVECGDCGASALDDDEDDVQE
jgi:hypothetical protein